MRLWSEGGAGWRAAASSPRALLAIGFALFLVYAFPGYMSSDSVLQLTEARSHVLSDAHPPFMAALWGVLDALVSGPILMLLLQGGLFLVGLQRLFARVLTPRAAAVVACAVLLFPPVLTPMAVIWKDSQMAAFLIAGTAALLDPRRSVRLGGLALMAAGCAFRHNAFAAAVPVVGLLFVWRPDARGWRRYACSTLAAIVVVGSALGINRLLTVKHQRLTPAFTDITGVLVFTRDRTDDDLRTVLRGTPLHVTTNIQAAARAIYSPRNAWQVTRGEGRLFDDAKQPAQWEALDRAWKELVTGDWGAYLQSRWATFRELLGLSDEDLMAPVWNQFLEAPEQVGWIEHQAGWSEAQRVLGLAFDWLAYDTPLFRPYLYVLIALALLALCRERLAFALLASGLLYELSFFPAAGTVDYRYSHWMILTTCLAGVLVFVQRVTRGVT